MVSDFQGFRFPLVRDEYKAGAGGAYDEITIGPVPSGHMWVINWIALEDETTDFTSLRVYIGGLGLPNHIMEQVTCTAATLYWAKGPLYLPEGRSLVLRFVGATAADVLKGYANGFDVIQPEGAPHA